MPAVVQHSLAPGRHLLPRLPPGPGRATAHPIGHSAESRSLGKRWVCALCKVFPRYIDDGRKNAHGAGRAPRDSTLARSLLWPGAAPGARAREGGLGAAEPLPFRSGPGFMQRWLEMKAVGRGVFSPCPERAWKQPASVDEGQSLIPEAERTPSALLLL